MAQLTINPAMLRWALKDSARTAADLAEAAGRDIEVVNRWLNGEDDELYQRDIRAASSLLGRSPYFFALPLPPEEDEQHSVRFRRAFDSDVEGEERALEISSVRWAQRIQRVAKSLVPEGYELAFPGAKENPTESADEVRHWLQWDTTTQTRATSKTAAFRALRFSIESRGVLVALRGSETERFCGFSLLDEYFPLIYVNRDYELASVRSFTLLHEFAHIVHGEQKICYGDDVGVERWCNQFAGSFLMPEDHVRAYWASQKLEFASATDTDPVRRVAQRYKTSWHAAAIRLVDLKLARQETVEYIRKSRPEPPEGGWAPAGTRNTATIRLDEYGAAYTSLLSQAVDEGVMSSLDARRRLNVDGRQLAQLTSLARAGGR